MRLGPLVVALVLLAGCGAGDRPAGETGVGATAPSAAGPLHEFRGAPLVANVWASW